MTDQYVLNLKLTDLPYTHRRWGYLSTYREHWDFLPNTLRDRIAEQVMAADYLMTLGEWLEPYAILKDRHKIIFLQTLATVYEGVLSHVVDVKMHDLTRQNDAVKRLYRSAGAYKEGRTFGPSIQLAADLGLINDMWRSRIDKLKEVRNWIHLSNAEKTDVKNWAMNKTAILHRSELDDFREYIKQHL